MKFIKIFTSPRREDTMEILRIRKNFIGVFLLITSALLLFVPFYYDAPSNFIFQFIFVGFIILSIQILKDKSLFETFFKGQSNGLKVGLIIIIAAYLLYWALWILGYGVIFYIDPNWHLRLQDGQGLSVIKLISNQEDSATNLTNYLLGAFVDLFYAVSIIITSFVLLSGRDRSNPLFNKLFTALKVSMIINIVVSIYFIIYLENQPYFIHKYASIGWDIAWGLSNLGQFLLFNNLLKTQIDPEARKTSTLQVDGIEENIANARASATLKVMSPGGFSYQDKVSHLKQLKELFDAGVLTQEEFDREKNKVLS